MKEQFDKAAALVRQGEDDVFDRRPQFLDIKPLDGVGAIGAVPPHEAYADDPGNGLMDSGAA